MAYNLGSAYINVVPSFKGFSKSVGAQMQSGTMRAQASSAGTSIGGGLVSSITSKVKTGLKLGGVIGGAIGAVTLKGGLDRALGIEDAQAKMRGLGYSTKDVSKIMDNALKSVEGTSFGLDSAATTAAGAVAAGIKPGKELEGVLKTVANTSAGAGTTMDEMGSIFNTVAANGKAYTGDIKMVADRGIPIWQSLGKNMGKTTGEVQKMASQGKISFKDFEAAAADASGNVAKSMGDTTRGSLQNMYASVKKLGAMFVVGLLPMAKTTFQGIQGLLNAVKDKLEPFVGEFFDKFGDKANGGIKSFFDGLIDRVNKFDPAPVVAFFREVNGGLKAFAAAWKYNDGDVTSSGFPGFMEKAAYWIHQFWDALKVLDLGGIGKSFSSLGDSMKGLSQATSGDSAQGIGNSLKTIALASPGLLAVGLQLLGKALTFINNNSGTLVKFLPLIAAGLVAWKVQSVAMTAAVTKQRLATAAMAPVMAYSNTMNVIATATEYRNIKAKNLATGATQRATLAEKLRTVATKAGAVASKVAAVAARGLGLAIRFMTGPVGLIIAGIALLVTGLVLFFTKTELGKKIIAAVWAGIKVAIAAVVDWFQNTALPFLLSAWNAIAAAGLWLWKNVMVPVWNGIKAAISAVANWVMTSLVPFFQSAWNAIAAAAMWLWKSVIVPVWNGIKVAIAVVIAIVVTYVHLWVTLFKTVLAPVFKWLYNSVIKPVWAGIKSAIRAVVAWFRDTAWPAIKVVVNALASAFKWLYNNVIKPVWSGIKAAIRAVVTWFRDTAWPAVKKVIDFFALGFKVMYSKYVKPVWAAVKAAIRAVVAWFRDTAWPIFSKVIKWIQDKFNRFKVGLGVIWRAIKSAISAVVTWFRDTAKAIFDRVIGKIKAAFQGMKDRLSSIWKSIKNNAIKPVVDWFSDTVKPKIDKFVGKVKDAFSGLKDSVVGAWNKIKSGMKKPINGVISIYNDHIADPFNKAIKAILGKKTKVQLGHLDGFATGGYTGAGSKYTPAGVVHADEFVIRKESQNSISRQAPGFLDALNTHGARALSGMGYGYAKGGKVLNGWKEISGIPHAGLSITSTTRPGARTAGTGSVSKHATGHAVDFSGSKSAMEKFFNFVRDNYKVSELIYTPMGGRQLSRGGIPRAKFPARTAAMHHNHVHVGGYAAGEKQGSAGGGGGGWFSNPLEGIWGKIKDKVTSAAGDGFIGKVLTGTVKKIATSGGDFIKDKILAATDFVGEGIDFVKNGVKGAFSAAKATAYATDALIRTGDFSVGNLGALMGRMWQESKYDPNAVNDWDSNAKAGNASRGLMQVIPSTFRAYRDKSLSSNIFNPLANIVAAINYTKSRYKSLKSGWTRKGGYAEGGWTGPGSKYTPAGVVHADEYVVQKSSRRSIEKARPGFLDRLNRHGAAALGGYSSGGLVGYASGGSVSPLSKIGSTKVSVILEGLTGTFKQVQTAAGKLADGIVKTFNDRMKKTKTATVNRLSDSLADLKSQASSLKKTITATTSKNKKNAINKLSDDLAALKKQKKNLSEIARETKKVTKVTGTSKSGKKITKTVSVASDAAKKAAASLKSVNRSIDATQTALTKARRGDYSSTAKAAQKRLASVQKQIEATDKALKAAKRGDYASAATIKGTKAYNKYVADGVSRLEEYANRQDTLTAKLKDATAALTEAKKVRDEYTSSLRDSFRGTYGLSAESATTGLETIIRGFKNGASTVATFQGQVRQLQARGLSAGLIEQITGLGATDGSKVAANLLKGTDAQIKEITKQFNALNSKSDSASTGIGRTMYQTGVDAASGLVKGLAAQSKAVEKASEALANRIVKTVRKKLDIHSPSRVFRQIGVFTGEGMVQGIEAVTPDVQSAMNRLATPPEAYSGSQFAVTGGGSAAGITITGGQWGYDPDSIARGIRREQKKQEALYAF